jgi:hypothetical protein
MEHLQQTFDSWNSVIGSSTFGRIFRLEGSGHVRAVHLHAMALADITQASGDQEYKIHY